MKRGGAQFFKLDFAVLFKRFAHHFGAQARFHVFVIRDYFVFGFELACVLVAQRTFEQLLLGIFAFEVICQLVALFFELDYLIRRLAWVLPECQDLRRCGSAALDICHVADGSLDGYYESLSLWDFAAAVLIAEEAGARLSHLYPTEFKPFYMDTRDWVITTPDIHEDLTRLLLTADAS